MKKSTRNALIASGTVFAIYMALPCIRGVLTALTAVLGLLLALGVYCFLRIKKAK